MNGGRAREGALYKKQSASERVSALQKTNKRVSDFQKTINE